MKICAYCDSNKNKITKEHVVNRSFIDRYYKTGKGYANVWEKYSENFLTVKDVCSKCNNEILSQLDSYFLDFYEANLPREIVLEDSQYSIEYNFSKLSKWLLKTSYNSERKNAYEYLPQRMHRYKDYIVGKNNKTKLFKVFLELLSDVSESDLKKIDNLPDDFDGKFNFLRVGTIIFPEQRNSGFQDLVKHVISSNFMFHIFVLNPGRHTDSIFKTTFEQYCLRAKTNKLYYLDPTKSKLMLRGSNRTIVDILEITYEGEKLFIDREK